MKINKDLIISDSNYSLEKVLTNLNELNGILLWKNPNVSADFNAQDITFSSSDYDYFKIFILATPNTSLVVTGLKGYNVNADSIININAGAGQTTGNRERQFGYINATKYRVSDCLTRENPSDPTVPGTINSRMIPYYIIGYKSPILK